MKGLLSPNNKLGQLLGKVTDMMFLNVLVLLCCLPIITAGAALTSMYSVLLDIYRGEGSNPALDFFRAMKSNLKMGTLLWLIYLVYLLTAAKAGDHAVFIVFTLLIIACVGTLFFTWALILQSRYDTSVAECLKCATLTWAKYPGSTFVFFVSIIITIALFCVVYTLPLLLLMGFTLPGMLSTTLAHRVFIELEGPEEDQPAAEPS